MSILFDVGPLGRNLNVDSDSKLMVTTSASGLFPFGFSRTTGRHIVTDGPSGRLVVNMQSAQAKYYITSTQSIAVTSGVYTAISGQSIDNEKNFQIHASGALQYTDSVTQKFLLNASLSVDTDTSSQDFSATFSINDTNTTSTEMEQRIADSDDTQNVSLTTIEELSLDDRVSVRITSLNGSPTFSINNFVLSANSLP